MHFLFLSYYRHFNLYLDNSKLRLIGQDFFCLLQALLITCLVILFLISLYVLICMKQLILSVDTPPPYTKNLFRLKFLLGASTIVKIIVTLRQTFMYIFHDLKIHFHSSLFIKTT
jgi:hypothetical protein